MTLLVNTEAQETPIHVLIVGVGWYGSRDQEGNPSHDSESLKELVGVGKTVERTVNWWRNAGSRFVKGHLSTLDVLLSVKSESIEFPTLDGPEVSPEPASLSAVISSIRRWRKRCSVDDESIGILHWIGHGIINGAALDERPGEQFLFCEDLEIDDDESFLKAVRIDTTIEELKRRKFAKVGIVFVDACRNFAGDSLEKIRSEPAFNISRDKIREEQDLLYYVATTKGAETYCQPSGLPACCFDGGALFTEAVLDALNEFGAANIDDEIQWAAYPDTVKLAINYRLQRWASHLKIPHQVAQLHENKQFDNAIVYVPNPKAMVDIGLALSERFLRAQLALNRDGKQLTPIRNGQQWEADLSVGCTWAAEGHLQSSMFGGNKRIYGSITPRPPYHKTCLEVDS